MNNYGYVYERILNKFNEGIFNKGENYSFNYYYGGDITDYFMDERTPEVCSSLMSYGKCKITDVPKSSITREFLLNSFGNKGVKEYIQSHLDNFDKQFYLDLICTNKYCTHFDGNVFSIIPLQYIDEEICSLAMINTMDWSASDWFEIVLKRKPEALSSDIWKLAARVYTKCSKLILDNVPNEYCDEEFYLELLSCSFNCGLSLTNNKSKVMDLIPDEKITLEFLIDLFLYDNKRFYDKFANLGAFNEKALETLIPIKGENIPFWKYVLSENGETIKYIPLNEERCEFFLSHYDKDSFAYTCYFKDKYKEFLKQENSNHNKAKKREQDNFLKEGTNLLFNNLMGKTIDNCMNEYDNNRNNTPANTTQLPIYYKGVIPNELRKKYDSEEYLEMKYKDIGIKIIGEYDTLYFDIVLPNGWTIKKDHYWNEVLDENGKTRISFFYDSKFYDRRAYVETIC